MKAETTAQPAAPAAPPPEDVELEQLRRTWASPAGFFGWFKVVNQTNIGRRFIITAFVFFLLAGVEALLLRLQLTRPEAGLLSPQLYNQLFTMHGTTMMFLFVVPALEGFGIYLVPLMLGARDMAFPRLNAFGYYVYLIAGVTLYAALLLNLAPDAGWFNYAPLANRAYSPRLGIDFYATMITFIEISALVAAVEIIATIFKQRAPGMSLTRMPIFVWAMLVMAFIIVFAMPAVMVASIMLALDRTVGSLFYVPALGGEPLLWQHLFWFFGHPDVYLILVPALGIASTIIVTFARRQLYGYTAIVLALVAIGFLSFGLWVHHMYTTGLPQRGMSFFTAASMMIAVPSGVQIFCWIATLWGSRPRLATPLWYVLGFFFVFILGGLTGVMIASVPFDLQVHDTYFIVAHFHYVLFGGAVFPLLGGLYYWFPKMFGRLLDERLGKWSFWLLFLGFNLTFFPMHQLGFQGMARRVYTYLPDQGWTWLNVLATVGAFITAASVAVTLYNIWRSLRRGARADANPWGAATLEWLTDSPVPVYNFRHLPVVRSRYPLWDEAAPEIVAGLRPETREVLLTSVLDAEPQAVSVIATPSVWPLLLALAVAVAFIGVIFSKLVFLLGALLSFICLVGWHWPGEDIRTPPWKESQQP